MCLNVILLSTVSNINAFPLDLFFYKSNKQKHQREWRIQGEHYWPNQLSRAHMSLVNLKRQTEDLNGYVPGPLSIRFFCVLWDSYQWKHVYLWPFACSRNFLLPVVLPFLARYKGFCLICLYLVLYFLSFVLCRPALFRRGNGGLWIHGWGKVEGARRSGGRGNWCWGYCMREESIFN